MILLLCSSPIGWERVAAVRVTTAANSISHVAQPSLRHQQSSNECLDSHVRPRPESRSDGRGRVEGSYGMTRTEFNLIKRALELLHRLVPDDGEPHAVDLAPRRCPVAMFAKKFLIRDLANDVTSQELWQFFGEVFASGELEALSKSEFLRRLPGVMASTFDVRKSHNIQRSGHRLRGFRGVGVRLDASPPSVVELEPEAV
jgi:hypothetical protein